MVKKLLDLKLIIKLYKKYKSICDFKFTCGGDVHRAAVCSNTLGCVDVKDVREGDLSL